MTNNKFNIKQFHSFYFGQCNLNLGSQFHTFNFAQCNNALSVTSLENYRYSSFVMRRKYTSLVRDTPHDLSDKFVSRLLNVFIDPKNTLVNNRESQKKIEKIIFDEYDVLFSSNTSKYIGGINTEMLGSVLSKYLMDKYSVLNKYIDYLFSQQTQLLANIDKLSDKNHTNRSSCFAKPLTT